MTDAARFTVPPVEKSVLVRCDPARAFAAFTAEIAQWWPMQNSLGGAGTNAQCRDRAEGWRADL